MENTISDNPKLSIKALILISICLLLLLTILFSWLSAQSLARDKIRAGDISLIGEFLKAYKADRGSFPSSSALAQPIGWENYLGFFPTAPVPAATGCTADSNQYKYNSISQGQSYSLSFCLGSAQNEFKSGLNVIKP